MMKKPLLIGIGNVHRGDDAAGLEAAHFLEERLKGVADIAYCRGDAMELIDLWKERNTLFLVDAVLSGKAPVGHLHRYEAQTTPLPALFSQASTHLLGIAQVIELSRALGSLPQTVIFYGIEASCFGMGEGMSKELKKALPPAVKCIESEILQNH